LLPGNDEPKLAGHRCIRRHGRARQRRGRGAARCAEACRAARMRALR